MFGIVRAEVDSYRLDLYLSDLITARDKMIEDLLDLKSAYEKAEWNDMVSEKARIQLNEYISRFNSSIELLDSVIEAAQKMCHELKNYESVIN